MNTDVENVNQAKESFNHVLDNKKYAGIIKDDNHLSLLLDLVSCVLLSRILLLFCPFFGKIEEDVF